MGRVDAIEPAFVRLVPEALEEGVLYISTEFATAIHLCCCGCLERVVTPLSPAQWSVTFDGESVSLWPSIGNHDLSCRSHYVIRRNQVRWARPWTSHEAEAGRRADLRDLKTHFGVGALDEVTAAPQATLTDEGLFTRLVRRFLRR